VIGYSLAQTMVQVLRQVRKRPVSRERHAAGGGLRRIELPMLLPGIRVDTSARDYMPVKQVQLMRFDGNKWVRFGDILTTEVRSTDVQSAQVK
jgi:hypothetical protein